ncbi:zinc finger protein 121-like isoform X1 [Phlebotomus argentipes]|uniref:zinc finger protein 121-like isoform X1 n=1 Tax=Phlebotomus argentipes TaxID=94469 RepID=UPI002892D374|nr:zinc finger protein 121-like isoform X1 [Phlebotomus argentipes]
MDKLVKNSLNNLCRGCLLNLDTADSVVFALCDESSSSEKFECCTNIKICASDGLPTNLCMECMDKCNSWYDFKKQCEESNEILQKLIHQREATEAPLEHLENASALVFTFSGSSAEMHELDSVILSEIDLGIKKDIAEDSQVALVGENSPDNSSNEADIEEPRSARKTKSARSQHRCASCKRNFRNEERYEAHMREHKGLKPEVCKICNKEFNNLRALRRHRIKHNDMKQYSCQTCGKQYKYATSLTLHTKVHKNIRCYICDLCGKSFIRAHGLQSHMLSHSTEKPFSCSTCDKTFKNQVMLKNHELRHNGVKRFICSVCGKCFTTSPELTTHTRSHTGIKPFKCTMCEKSYKTKSHLAVHMRCHTGLRPYACDLCPQKFAHNKVLKQHRLTHTGERPYSCDVCQRPFRQKSTLKAHLKTHKQVEQSPTMDQFSVASYLGDGQTIEMSQSDYISM